MHTCIRKQSFTAANRVSLQATRQTGRARLQGHLPHGLQMLDGSLREPGLASRALWEIPLQSLAGNRPLSDGAKHSHLLSAGCELSSALSPPGAHSLTHSLTMALEGDNSEYPMLQVRR